MRHIYLHVPFCRRRCSYCDFSIAVRKRIPAARYVESIRREHALRISAGEWDGAPLETLYFGGGTPSLLPADALAELVGCFLAHRPPSSGSSSIVEVTVEANPDDVTPESVAVWTEAGVNRVSVGVQSFHPSVLAWMHRTHDASASKRAVAAVRAGGIPWVSVDLIFALPESLEHDFRRDLEQALTLDPDHVSVYGLSIEPRTPLARWVSRGAIGPASDERYATEFLLAHDVLTKAGYDHYEVSNYARPGRRARHNGAYWQGVAYAGLGPSAHRFDGTRRAWNVAPWAQYERMVARGEDPTAEREVLTAEQRSLETVYLGLRTTEGVSRVLFHAQVSDWLEDAARRGWLRMADDRVCPTPEGWLRLDQLAGFLTTPD